MLETSPSITFYLHMVADDTSARKILEEDHQAAKGTQVPRLQDPAANQLAMKNIMSPGRRVTRAFVVKGTKKRLWYLERKKESS
jgi:hypothetical protein